MKKTGIWVDKDKALIVTLEGDKERFQTVKSNIEHYNPKGGSGTRSKGGPQDVVQDSKYLEREHHQLKQYFQNIVSQINDTESFVIFGPAETNMKLRKEINQNHKNLSNKLVAVEKADSMTDNQVKAWVRNYFA